MEFPPNDSNSFGDMRCCVIARNGWRRTENPVFVPETSRQMQEWIKELMLSTSMKALVECSRSLASTHVRSELPKINVPTCATG